MCFRKGKQNKDSDPSGSVQSHMILSIEEKAGISLPWKCQELIPTMPNQTRHAEMTIEPAKCGMERQRPGTQAKPLARSKRDVEGKDGQSKIQGRSQKEQ